MQLFIKQKIFSWFGQDFLVKNEKEEPVFKITSKLSITQKYHIKDPQDNLIYTIKKRAFRWFARFDILDKDNKLVGIVKRKFAIFAHNFNVTNLQDSSEYKLQGDFFAWNFSLIKDGKELMNVQKKVLRILDTYMVAINDESLASFALAVAIIVDAECHNRRKKR